MAKKTFLIVLFCLANSCSKNKNTTIIKLAHSLDVTHPVNKAMVYMSDRVKEKSVLLTCIKQIKRRLNKIKRT